MIGYSNLSKISDETEISDFVRNRVMTVNNLQTVYSMTDCV